MASASGFAVFEPNPARTHTLSHPPNPPAPPYSTRLETSSIFVFLYRLSTDGSFFFFFCLNCFFSCKRQAVRVSMHDGGENIKVDRSVPTPRVDGHQNDPIHPPASFPLLPVLLVKCQR